MIDHRKLGQFVLLRAFLDAVASPRTNLGVYRARGFLLGGSADFAFWCEVAGVPPSAVKRAAQRLREQDWREDTWLPSTLD